MSKDKQSMVKRAYLIYFGFVLIMCVIIYKTFAIQFEGKKNMFDGVDTAIPVRHTDRIPRMGEILDANLLPLVTSVSFYDVHMDATVVDQKLFDEDLAGLAAGLHRLYPDKSAREYENSIRTARENGSRYLLIRKKVTNQERKNLNLLPIFCKGRMKGGIIDNTELIVRQKPNGNLLNRTLGYYKIVDGKEVKVGIEGAYIDYLKGEPGKEIEQKIATGWKRTGQITKEAVEGADVVSTIDKEIQEVAHSELENQLMTMEAASGCVIVMEVKTGYIKAIANLTREENGSFSESWNYAIGSPEVPGSTFKLASIMAALEDNKIGIQDKVNAFGVYQFNGGKLSDSNHGLGYGVITLQKAFEKSSNVIAAVINKLYRSEPEMFMKRLDDFGLLEPMGIDLEGEGAPQFHRPGETLWSPLSIPWMSIGYEYRQTPLQTLAFYNAVANNGKFLKPLFVQDIRRRGKVIKHFNPVVLKERIASQKTIDIMKRCLEGVMTVGTGSDLKSSQFKIAGKTGTAKLPGKDKRYADANHSVFQASFAGYFPADKPKYSCVVVITDPKTEYYGARVSGTVFAAVANKVWASSMEYHKAVNVKMPLSTNSPSVKTGNKKDLTLSMKLLNVRFQLNNEGVWLTTDTLKNTVHLNKMSTRKGYVPNVIGMTAKDAVFLLEKSGLVVRIKGYGKVRKQSMAAGELAFKGGVVIIELGQ